MPFGPSKPSREPWPPATVRNAVLPARIASSPASRASPSAPLCESGMYGAGSISPAGGCQPPVTRRACISARSTRSSPRRSSSSRARMACGRASQWANRCPCPSDSNWRRTSASLPAAPPSSPRARVVMSASTSSARISESFARRSAAGPSSSSHIARRAPSMVYFLSCRRWRTFRSISTSRPVYSRLPVGPFGADSRGISLSQ